MPLTAGTLIGPYEVLDWIGAGGMGEVYRARDPRLGRDVAIKLIRETLATDRSRLHRFEQEARAAGQLNHPNILAVYDIGTHADAPYIVSELLEGASLRARLQNGALVSRKATDYARQMAEGLAAAHDKGIVHRDLKPDNLFITSDGRLKILDFGIAKLTRPSDETSRRAGLPTETADGLVLGTTGYMSPEQVRGEDVDARSDLFSFGAILHEMLSGRAAFIRASAAETMAAILKEDPHDVSSTTVSPALERIVARCLEKSREARFQSARDLGFALEMLPGTTGSVAKAAAAAAPRRSRMTVGVAATILVAAVAGWLIRGAPAIVEDPFAHATFTRFTDWPGREGPVDISPDGSLVAFVSDRDGQLDLFRSQVGTSDFLKLAKYGPQVQGIFRKVGFSGNAADIWFAPGYREPTQILPQTGGVSRPFLGDTAQAPSWSHSGDRIVYFDNFPVDTLMIADRIGANAEPILIAPSDLEDWSGGGGTVHNHNPIWSVDDEWIYFVHGVLFGLNQNDPMDIWRVRPSGGAPERLTRQNMAVTFLAALDARTIVYTACDEDGSGPWLWVLDVESRKRRKVVSGLEHYTSVAASHDGQRLVATVSNPKASLFTVPIDRLPTDRDVRPFPVQAVRALAPRFGGASTSVFFLSNLGTGDGLWRFDGAAPIEIWKGANGTIFEPPGVSHDGKRVAIVLSNGGRRQLAVMSRDGTNPRRLAKHVDIQGAVEWSYDDKWVVAGGIDVSAGDNKREGIFMIPADGGTPVQLTNDKGANPIWSRHDLIVYSGQVEGGLVPLRAVRPDKSAVALPDVRVQAGSYRFMPDGSGVVYIEKPGTADFWLFDLAKETKRVLTHLNWKGKIQTFDISADSKQILFDVLNDNSDIVLIELPKKK